METRCRFAAVPASIAEIRHAAREQAQQLGADAVVVEALTLCVSEAATNVVVHAYRDRGQPGRLELETHRPDGWICVYVRDDGVGMAPRSDSPGAGLGLMLISQLATDVVVRTPCRDGRGTEMVMRFDLAA